MNSPENFISPMFSGFFCIYDKFFCEISRSELLDYILLPQFPPHNDIDDFFDEFALAFL
jgi:hypothetical protein